ncbi:MAG: lipid-A-disaccharide synthase [Micropepsaceae bacterium]
MIARPLTVMVSAGEPSGDALGAGLISALRRLHPGVRIVGVGGPAMRAEGLVSFFDIAEIAVMGIAEVVPKLRTIFRRIRQVADFALRVKPDVVVLIDSGDFHHRVARRIKAADRSIPIVKYVSPQVWASRPRRAAGMKDYLDHILCLLPFEPAFYDPYGLPATFVGHPALERAAAIAGGGALRTRLGIPADAKVLCVLPGSRRVEVSHLLPVFKAAAGKVASAVPGLVCVIPTVRNVEPLVVAGCSDWPTEFHVLRTPDERFAAFDLADAALAASGTVTTELAIAGVPMVVAYKVGAVTAAIWRRLVKVAHVTIANLVIGRRAIPEFIQEQATPAALAAAVVPLLTNADAIAAQKAALSEAVDKLGTKGSGPSRLAAEAVLKVAAAGA